MNEDGFDPQKALAEARANAPNRAVRKLSFPEKCGIFAYLHSEPDSEIEPTAEITPVARAFDLSRPTVSAIAHCLTGTRYGEVRREYLRLGPKAFSDRYYTQEIHLRIQKARFLKPPPVARGPNPAATKYAFKGGGQNPPFGAIECFENFYRIDWLDEGYPDYSHGWWYAPCAKDGSIPPTQTDPDHFYWRGQQETSEPFLTSTAAYRELWRIQTGEDPLRGGRK